MAAPQTCIPMTARPYTRCIHITNMHGRTHASPCMHGCTHTNVKCIGPPSTPARADARAHVHEIWVHPFVHARMQVSMQTCAHCCTGGCAFEAYPRMPMSAWCAHILNKEVVLVRSIGAECEALYHIVPRPRVLWYVASKSGCHVDHHTCWVSHGVSR
jgi:hypothetical protein